VELGARRDAGAVEWKFDVAPFAELEQKYRTKLRLLQRGDDNQWVFKDLDHLHELGKLPEEVLKFIPESGTHTIQIQTDDGKKTVRITVEREGQTIELQQDDGGEIVVTRTDARGAESTATYADEAALQKADEEAYDLYKQVGSHMVVELDMDGTPAPPDADFDFDFDFDSGTWTDALHDWHGRLEESMGEAREAYDDAMEQLHEAIAEWKQGQGPAIPRQIEELPQLLERLRAPAALAPLGKPQQSFQVQPDGRIEVKIRKGDSELVHLFENEADLAQRNPELYAKFQDLSAADD